MVAAGKIEEVRAYCLSDIAQTVALLFRVQLLRGELPAEGYLVAMERLLEVIDTEPRLEPLRGRLNRERLLLREAPVDLVTTHVVQPVTTDYPETNHTQTRSADL